MLSIDISLIVVILTVWILLALLTRIFFKPLRKIMEERESRVKGNVEGKEEALETFERESLRVEEKLREARAAAQATKEKFQKQALKERERILEKIHRDCRSQVDAAKRRLEMQMKTLKKELASQSTQMAERIEKRILH